MKRIFSVFFVCMILMITGACQAPKWEPFTLYDYQTEAPVVLRVSDVVVDNQAPVYTELPHIEKRIPISPAKAIENWANARLMAGLPTADEVLVVTINEASMVQEKKESGKWYILDNLVYTLTYDIEVSYSRNGQRLASQSISGWEKKSLPKRRASLADKEKTWKDMMNIMVQKINDKLLEDLPNELLLN